jgi:ABC-type transport system substrate-binding protein
MSDAGGNGEQDYGRGTEGNGGGGGGGAPNAQSNTTTATTAGAPVAPEATRIASAPPAPKPPEEPKPDEAPKPPEQPPAVVAEATPKPVPPVPPTTTSAAPGPVTTLGRISRKGETLSLVIGAAANDPTAVAVANTAADQLRSAGIAATVLAQDPPVLYGTSLVNNRVDAIVGWSAAGGDLATLLASRFGCPALEAAPVATRPFPGPAAKTTPSRPSDPDPLIRAPSNLTGICDRTIEPKISAALDGSMDINAVIAAVEPRLWAMSTVLPIMQDSTIVAAGPSVRNVSLTGAVPIGIVGDAGMWAKAP